MVCVFQGCDFYVHSIHYFFCTYIQSRLAQNKMWIELK